MDGEANRDRESPETGGGRLACNCDGDDGVVVGGRERDWERSRVESVSDVVDAFIGRVVVVVVFLDNVPGVAEEEDSVTVVSPFTTAAEDDALDVFCGCGSKAAARESNG